MRFPYDSKATLSFGSIPTVKLQLDVQTTDGFTTLLFLFDTGADVTSFPKSAAKKLGVNLKDCPAEVMTGFTGKPTKVFISKITMRLGKKIFAIPCVFNPYEKVPIILGKAGILTRFNIFLNGKAKQIIFEDIV